MRVSPSQLKVYRSCPQQWDYSYRQGLRTHETKRVFEIGTYTHELLHVLYQHMQSTGLRPGTEMAQNVMRQRIDSDEITSANVEIMSIVWPLVIKYVSYQSPKIDKDIAVLGVEQEFYVDIEGVTLHGFIDLVYRDAAGRIRVRDHKTSGQKNAWNQNKLKMEDQLLFYALAMSKHYDEPVYDVEINFLNTYPYKNKVVPTEDLFALYRYTHNAESLKAFETNLIQQHSNMETVPITRSYSANCCNCKYFQLCHLEARGHDTTEVRKFLFDNAELDKRPPKG